MLPNMSWLRQVLPCTSVRGVSNMHCLKLASQLNRKPWHQTHVRSTILDLTPQMEKLTVNCNCLTVALACHESVFLHVFTKKLVKKKKKPTFDSWQFFIFDIFHIWHIQLKYPALVKSVFFHVKNLYEKPTFHISATIVFLIVSSCAVMTNLSYIKPESIYSIVWTLAAMWGCPRPKTIAWLEE